MPNFLEPLLDAMTAKSSLPRDDGADIRPSTTTNTTTTTSTHVTSTTPTPQTESPVLPSVLLARRAKAKSNSKKRNRIPDFTVFTDQPPSSTSNRPAPKKSKTGTRIPLGPRSPNTPAATPPPRSPDTPFRFSDADPYWSDIENHDPRPYTPPPAPPPRPSSARGPAQPPRPLRPRRSVPLSAPRSMALYTMLGITEWTVGAGEVAAAWRRAALENHPDRVGEEEKDAATRRMQRLNAAKEVLCDEEKRRQYDVDGEVPWGEEE